MIWTSSFLHVHSMMPFFYDFLFAYFRLMHSLVAVENLQSIQLIWKYWLYAILWLMVGDGFRCKEDSELKSSFFFIIVIIKTLRNRKEERKTKEEQMIEIKGHESDLRWMKEYIWYCRLPCSISFVFIVHSNNIIICLPLWTFFFWFPFSVSLLITT